MDRYEFLQKILPSTELGTYVATVSAPNPRDISGDPILYNRGFDSTEDLANFCHGVANRGATAYFALATFAGNTEIREDGRTRWRRKASMAQAFKTLAVDIDCGPGKPYADQREGIRALGEFLKAADLPKPLVVSSGYGLHCYWPLSTAVDTTTWRSVSTDLKNLAVAKEFKIDESKVCDPAMVLRPLDTKNFKGDTSADVRLLWDGGPFDNEELFSKIVGTHRPARAVRTSERSALFEAMEAAEESRPPADPEKIVSRCAQMRRITFNHGANASEPEWYVAAGVANYCENPEDTFHDWSRGHDKYNPEAAMRKLHQWKDAVSGPPTCSQFDRLCPGICATCAFMGKIGSPVRLGAPEPKKLEETDDPNRPHPMAEPPEPFSRTDRGVTVDISGVPQQICSYDLFPSHIVFDPANGYDEAVWYWNKPFRGYTKFTVRMAHIFNDAVTELNNVLADNGVLIETKQKQVYVGGYMRAYIQKLQKLQQSRELHTSFGWKNGFNSFIIGSTEFRREPDGTVTSHEVGISKELTERGLDDVYVAKGDADKWVAWTKLFSDDDLVGHRFAIGVGFSAPLYALTSLNGGFVNLLGPSGCGKSSVQAMMMSIFGNPIRACMKAEDTKLAIVQRLGYTANLGITVDEITNIPAEKVCDLAFWATQGQDRNRATDSVAKNWAHPMTCSANSSARDKVSSVMADPEAVLMRMFEVDLKPNRFFSDVTLGLAARLGDFLRENHGTAGRRFISHLLSIGAERLREMISENYRTLGDRYGVQFEGKERYWILIISLADLAHRLAKEAGLVKYNTEEATAWAMAQIPSQRSYISTVTTTPYDMLSSYINSHVGSSLTVIYHNNGHIKVADPIPRYEVHIRKEVYNDAQGRGEKGFLYLDRRHFQQWLVSNGMDFKHAFETFTLDGVAVRPNASGKYTMGKDTPLKLGQVSVLALSLSHPRLRYMLDGNDSGEMDAGGNVVALRR